MTQPCIFCETLKPCDSCASEAASRRVRADTRTGVVSLRRRLAVMTENLEAIPEPTHEDLGIIATLTAARNTLSGALALADVR